MYPVYMTTCPTKPTRKISKQNPRRKMMMTWLDTVLKMRMWKKKKRLVWHLKRLQNGPGMN